MKKFGWMGEFPDDDVEKIVSNAFDIEEDLWERVVVEDGGCFRATISKVLEISVASVGSVYNRIYSLFIGNHLIAEFSENKPEKGYTGIKNLCYHVASIVQVREAEQLKEKDNRRAEELHQIKKDFLDSF